MSVTYGMPQQIDAVTWRLPVTTDAFAPATLYVYRDGVLVDTVVTSTGRADLWLSVPAGTNPYYEVLDEDCRRQPAHPGRFTVYWTGVSGAVSYTIEEFVASVWTERATVRDDGAGAFRWISRWLEDVATHQFRVSATDAAGNSSSTTSFSALMVRRPDIPDATVAKTAAALTLDVTA